MPVPGTSCRASTATDSAGGPDERRPIPGLGRAVQAEHLPLAGLRHAADRIRERPEIQVRVARRPAGRPPRPAGSTHASSVRHREPGALVEQGDRAEIAQERDRLAGQRRAGSPRSRAIGQDGARLGEEGRAPRRLLGGGPRRLRPRQRHVLLGLALDLLRLLVEVDEDADLGPEDLRHDRREDVVDRAQRVALGGVHLVAERGDEDDRRLRRLAAAPDHGGRLQPVHVRHVHVEQDDREFLVQQVPQRLPPERALTRFWPRPSRIVS